MQTFSIWFFFRGWFCSNFTYTRDHTANMLKRHSFGKWKIFFFVVFISSGFFWWIKRSHTVKIQFCKLFCSLVVVVDFCFKFFVSSTPPSHFFVRTISFFFIMLDSRYFGYWVVWMWVRVSVCMFVCMSQKAKERKILTALIRRSNKSIVFYTVYAYPRLTKKRKTETQ